MAVEGLLITLLIGAVAGWLAGVIVKGYGFGIVGNIVVGIVGAFVAGLLLPGLGWQIGGNPIVGSVIFSTIGAVILLLVIRFFRRVA